MYCKGFFLIVVSENGMSVFVTSGKELCLEIIASQTCNIPALFEMLLVFDS